MGAHWAVPRRVRFSEGRGSHLLRQSPEGWAALVAWVAPVLQRICPRLIGLEKERRNRAARTRRIQRARRTINCLSHRSLLCTFPPLCALLFAEAEMTRMKTPLF